MDEKSSRRTVVPIAVLVPLGLSDRGEGPHKARGFPGPP